MQTGINVSLTRNIIHVHALTKQCQLNSCLCSFSCVLFERGVFFV
jgi:hypothetical protein